MQIRVLVSGATGKMGQETVRAIQTESDLMLVGQTGSKDMLLEVISIAKPDVVVDFTHPSVAFENTMTILKSGCHAVIGTTGLSEDNLTQINQAAVNARKSAIVCPNFAIGAVLLMTAAAKIATYMPHVEIIEMHHNQKADSPSGTAIKTAQLIWEGNNHINATPLHETELIPGARGGKKHNIPIHSVRLPGYVAHQEVIFGGLGQTLSLRHDSISRESFMPGVVLSIRKSRDLTGLVYGLENLL